MAAMKTRAAITLLVLCTVLPELFTGSTSLSAFLNPGMVVFLFFGYGVAVLLVRELAVRCHSGILGLFFMGMGYAIFNEGFLAKTMILKTGLPVSQYNDYGYWLGISFAWSAGISAWHGMASVLIPIQLTHHFFPKAKSEPWVNGKFALCLGILLMSLASAGFLGASEKGVTGTRLELGVLLSLIVLLFALGAHFKENPHPVPTHSIIKPLLLGTSVLIPFWGLAFVAASKAPVIAFFPIWAGVICLYAWILRRCHMLSMPGFLYFGMGWYLHNVIQAVLLISLVMKNPGMGLATLLIDGLILALLFAAIRRCDGNTHSCPSAE
jgi:hypothetical protein